MSNMLQTLNNAEHGQNRLTMTYQRPHDGRPNMILRKHVRLSGDDNI